MNISEVEGLTNESQPFDFLNWAVESETQIGEKYRRSAMRYIGNLAKECERYHEESECAFRLAALLEQNAQEPSKPEMEFFATGFYDNFANLRKIWKELVKLKDRETKTQRKFENDFLDSYKDDIAQELINHCQNVIKVLSTSLTPLAKTKENQVILLKLVGDFFRYMSEVFEGVVKYRLEHNALSIYKEASEMAKDLEVVSPPRLGVNLNLSILLYERLGRREEALELTRKSFSQATSGLQYTPDSQYNEVYFLMMSFKERIERWEKELRGQSVFDD